MNVMLPECWEDAAITLPPTLEHPQGEPVPPPNQEQCHHPVNFHVRGGNQHGKWKKCSMCGKKLWFTKWGPENPPSSSQKIGKAKKNQTLQTFVSTGSTAASSSADQLTALDVQAIMQQQTEYMAQNTASSLSQAMMPMMQAMQQMAQTQEQLQTTIQNQQLMLNQVMAQQGQQLPLAPRAVETLNIGSDDEMEAAWKVANQRQ